MATDFPEEIIVEILSLLPVKSLMRFKSVKRSWDAIFKNPYFITQHLNRSTSSNNPTFIFKCTDDKILSSSLSVNDGTLSGPIVFDTSFLPTCENLHIVGSSNGLVCLSVSGESGSVMYLWNPATREAMDVCSMETLKLDYKGHSNGYGYGFSYFSYSNDYVIVRISIRNNSYTNSIGLYKRSTNSWRNINYNTFPNYFILDYRCRPVLRGAFHWLAYANDEVYTTKLIILSFNVGSEALDSIRMPDFTPDGTGTAVCQYVLAVVKDSLAAVVANQEERCSDVWIMNKYFIEDSWTKLYSVGNFPELRSLIRYEENGELLLITDKGKLMRYDPNANDEAMKTLAVFRDTIWNEVFFYKESLVVPILGQ